MEHSENKESETIPAGKFDFLKRGCSAYFSTGTAALVFFPNNKNWTRNLFSERSRYFKFMS